jgi:hypothetical protein
VNHRLQVDRYSSGVAKVQPVACQEIIAMMMINKSVEIAVKFVVVCYSYTELFGAVRRCYGY